MKKFLQFLSINLVILSNSLTLIACKAPELAEIWIITDGGGDLFDKAFSQQILEGAQDFTKNFNENRASISSIFGFEDWKNNSLRLKWIISSDGQQSTLQNNYNIAAYAGAKTIICAGFGHNSALTLEIQEIFSKMGVKFILVDTLIEKQINTAILTYASEESSFLSALASAIWLVANHETYESNKELKMSAFGALPIDTIVEFMMGFYWGVYYFNEFRNSDVRILAMINIIRNHINKEEMKPKELKDNKYKIIFDKLQNSFTGDFASGSNNAKILTSKLINDNKNSVVLPVAGGQTLDLISTISNSSKNKNAKIVGVDVDQSQQYEFAKDYFITSALKKIRVSVEWMLWKSFDLSKKVEGNKISFDFDFEAKKYFNGQKEHSSLASTDYLGISDNSKISDIFEQLNSDEYWNLASKVTDYFKKLSADLASNPQSDNWKNAWDNIDQSENIPDFD